MSYSAAKNSVRLSAVILMMIALVLTSSEAVAKPMFKVKAKQVNTTTNIKLKVSENTKVWMNVYSPEGRYVAELMNEKRVKKGKAQNVELNTNNWKTGTYTVEIRTESGKMWTEQLVIGA